MAGSRHHILPKFLLKGFASKIDGEDVFTWVFRNGAKPYESNTKNVSVEKHFYGKSSELNADDEITKLESDYAILLNILRTSETEKEIDNYQISDFVSHLFARSKFVRDFFRNSSEFLFTEIERYLSNYENARKLILNNPRMVRKELEKFLQNLLLERWQRQKIRKNIHKILPAFLDSQKDEYQSHIQTYLSKFTEMLPKAISEGHIKVLKEKPSPQVRADDYRTLHWYVLKASEELILGDFGVIFENSGGLGFSPIHHEIAEVVNVLLPISSCRMLVGTNSLKIPELDFGLINDETAKSCREYFVSSSNSNKTQLRHYYIGQENSLIGKDELEKLAIELINDIEKGKLE